jgi:hypothetical protein
MCAVVLGVFWTASELHYRNCVEAATASTPDPRVLPPRVSNAEAVQKQIDRLLDGKPATEPADTSRADAVAKCSRSPF